MRIDARSLASHPVVKAVQYQMEWDAPRGASHIAKWMHTLHKTLNDVLWEDDVLLYRFCIWQRQHVMFLLTTLESLWMASISDAVCMKAWSVLSRGVHPPSMKQQRLMFFLAVAIMYANSLFENNEAELNVDEWFTLAIGGRESGYYAHRASVLCMNTLTYRGRKALRAFTTLFIRVGTHPNVTRLMFAPSPSK